MGAITSPRSGAAKPTCGIYLLEGGKGSIIYHAVVPAPGGSPVGCNSIRTTLAENWFVYSYFNDDVSDSGQAKGQVVVSVEVYEGKGVDDKTFR